MNETQTRFVLEGSALDTLKLAAMILMVIDHINAVFFEGSYLWMHALGRGAFPLFAYSMACNLQRGVPLTKYVERLAIFAFISQIFYMIGLGGDDLNILFTLLLASIAGVWAVNQPQWRRQLLFLFGFTSFFFDHGVDFDFAGVMLPALLACAMAGDRFSWIATLVLLALLNFGISDFAVHEGDTLVFFAPSVDMYVSVISTLLIPLLVFGASRHIKGARFLPRYSLYIFYPAHLALLALYNLVWGTHIYDYISH